MTNRPRASDSAPSDAEAVAAWLRALKHPRKRELEAVRKTILGVDERITEGIKWKAPSFRVREWFATVNVRKDELLVVLHLGVKTSKFAKTGMEIDDPDCLLEWLAKDRAAVRFRSAQEWRAGKGPFVGILRQWITHLA